ncbi:MAG: PEGA domain-containing protein [Candidatus Rokubacteria bacterium]|nr:PEGA domain-containing protein [Candidatus Rokubacteria bacterium]
MRFRRPALALAVAFGLLAILSPCGPAAAADTTRPWSYSDPTPEQLFVLTDVYPPDAQVVLNGRYLGIGRDILAHGITIAPGRYTVEVSAPGFAPYVTRFNTNRYGLPTMVRARLWRE